MTDFYIKAQISTQPDFEGGQAVFFKVTKPDRLDDPNWVGKRLGKVKRAFKQFVMAKLDT